MVTPRLKRRLQTWWHVLRRRLGADPGKPQRLVIEKAKWLHDVRSPVMLSIDDLTNAWHNRQGGKRWEAGGDWGGGLWEAGSALRFLDDHLLRDFLEVKITFFAVAGPISAYTHHQPFSYVAPLDATEESKRFFRSIAEDPRFELAYHGFNHGTAGERTEDFLQEWQGFSSVDAAVAQTKRGLEIFARATGAVPSGGKYGGWEYNEFAEEAVDRCGFMWWCRDWMPRDITGRIPDEYYEEAHVFGAGLVVALPTTLHGRFWYRRQIDLLLACRQVIAIEEHIASVRPDGFIQTPNIVDDIEDLRRLLRYLRGKDVWHATGSEIASYVIARERSLIYDVTEEGFSVRYNGRIERPSLTLRIDCSAVCTPAQPLIEVDTPDGTPAECRFDERRYRHLITVPVMEGRYHVRPRIK
jgi:hypothetical protein